MSGPKEAVDSGKNSLGIELASTRIKSHLTATEAAEDVAGYKKYLEMYKSGLAIEEAATKAL